MTDSDMYAVTASTAMVTIIQVFKGMSELDKMDQPRPAVTLGAALGAQAASEMLRDIFMGDAKNDLEFETMVNAMKEMFVALHPEFGNIRK